MKLNHSSLGVMLLCAVPGAALAGLDVKQCQRIDDVAVPYDVATDSTSVTFSTKSDRIVVRESQIEAGGKIFKGEQVGSYYGGVRSFLDHARTMVGAVSPFSGGKTALGAAATQMCTAIVDIAASNAAVEQAFPGFESPIRVKFK